MGPCQLWLTCKDRIEADNIVKVLLDQKLISCAKQIQITSEARWQDKIENASEILILMDSREDLFEKVEAEISRIHSYETFVLQAVPMKLNKDASNWLNDSLQK